MIIFGVKIFEYKTFLGEIFLDENFVGEKKICKLCGWGPPEEEGEMRG